MLNELDDHHVRMRPDVFQPIDDSTQQHERVARYVNQDDAELFVAEINSNIVGLATVHISPNPDAPMFRPGSRACLNDLVVNCDFRKMGIAKLLLNHVAQWTRSRGLQSIAINVWNENTPAMEFFTASGFTPRCQQLDFRVDEGR